jgi:hypothetical protein
LTTIKISNKIKTLVVVLIVFSYCDLYSQKLKFNNESDTIVCGKIKFISEKISESEYNYYKRSSKSKYYLPSATSKITEAECEFAVRINYDSILLKMNNGQLEWIANSPGGKYGFSYKGYTFMDYISDINQFIFVSKGYERDGYSMIHNPTGIENDTALLQTLSIDTLHKMAITTTFDGFAFKTGGFILYKIENGSLERLCELKEEESYTNSFFWAITDVYWTSPIQFVYIQRFEHRIIDFQNDWFIKITIEEKENEKRVIENAE